MLTGVIACFIIGYLVIVFEHPLKLDKTVPALLMGGICWAFISLGHVEVFDHHGYTLTEAMDKGFVNFEAYPQEKWEEKWLGYNLLHHIGKVAEILIFLIGAMTIVELIDLHRGFAVITNRIKTTSKFQMLVLVSILAFFLSATLDNLASTIVLVSLLRRLVPDKEERLWFVSMGVIAANAGGAWSPIGDVTTTMLWIQEKVSTLGLITHLVIPSIVCIAVPLLIASRLKAFQGSITLAKVDLEKGLKEEKILGSKRMLGFGIGGLIFVPIFKTFTHLPPYVGMMIALGVVWLVSEIIHRDEEFERKEKYMAHHALSRIEISSILFFLGILVAVAALETTNVLANLADDMRAALDLDVMVVLLGAVSAMIDNVPLVAASIGMFGDIPQDDQLWHFIAYSAGTGGSMLIIGSAAGVAAMGMERIDFIWYFKNVAWIAAIGFLAGAGVFILMREFLFV